MQQLNKQNKFWCSSQQKLMIFKSDSVSIRLRDHHSTWVRMITRAKNCTLLGAQRSLCTKITRIPGMVLSFQRKSCITCFSIQMVVNWVWLIAWWFVLSEGPGHVKLPQPGLRILNSLNDLYIFYLARTPWSSHNWDLK